MRKRRPIAWPRLRPLALASCLHAAGCGEHAAGPSAAAERATVAPAASEGPASAAPVVTSPPLPLADPHAGRRYSLGIQSIGGATVTALQVGGVHPGRQSLIRLTVFGVEDDTEVRVWLGRARAPEAHKTLARQHGREAEHYAHVIASDPLPADAAWWVEIGSPDGADRARSFPINF